METSVRAQGLKPDSGTPPTKAKMPSVNHETQVLSQGVYTPVSRTDPVLDHEAEGLEHSAGHRPPASKSSAGPEATGVQAVGVRLSSARPQSCPGPSSRVQTVILN